MFLSTYVPRYLCSPVPIFPECFFFGGGGEKEAWGVLEQFVDKIGRLVFFFKMVAPATLEDLLLLYML